MGTHGLFSFEEDDEAFSVYVHWDSYPEGAADKLNKTLESLKIWPLPRYEADEFAAGFIAANKVNPGGFRLANFDDSIDHQYQYKIWQDEKSHDLMIKLVCDDSEWDNTIWIIDDFIKFMEWKSKFEDDEYDTPIEEMRALFYLEEK